MLNTLFCHKNNNYIYKGTKKQASPIKECHSLPTQTIANYIDKQEQQIKQLEQKAKSDIMVRYYIYGY